MIILVTTSNVTVRTQLHKNTIMQNTGKCVRTQHQYEKKWRSKRDYGYLFLVAMYRLTPCRARTIASVEQQSSNSFFKNPLISSKRYQVLPMALASINSLKSVQMYKPSKKKKHESRRICSWFKLSLSVYFWLLAILSCESAVINKSA